MRLRVRSDGLDMEIDGIASGKPPLVRFPGSVGVAFYIFRH